MAVSKGLSPLQVESDLYSRVVSCNPVISIAHVPRSCNKVAHATASWAFGFDISVFWKACPLSWLSQLAVFDFVPVSLSEF
ncbi:hypothetical protein EZV62_015639 [Acer yangbiense]|uniref:RNase H type-1 domain-containing protein n=1 Tax=Acer yangbiense TaxID=1000413 RepID=A0A5C7HLB3_9ROSI|nr:hypothetical protein EZV62_015639 [Acer yangbiense]